MATTVSKPRSPRSIRGAVSVGRRIQPGAHPTVELNLSWRAYWALSLGMIAVYLGVWLANFHDVYGWIMDDRYYYLKGLATVQDWRNAFTPFNYVQTYHLAVSYLPLKLGAMLDSVPLPEFGTATGQFRLLLLFTLILHAGILLVWAAVSTKITGNRLAAAASLLVLATSPVFIFWSPLPDSRMLGLPFFLPGWFLLHRTTLPFNIGTKRGAALRFFVIGSLFGIAQSVQYTTLYVILPVCAAYWGSWLLRHWRIARCWQSLGAFVVGCVWLAVVYEILNGVVVGIPLEYGPFMTMVERLGAHHSFWTRAGDLAIWAEIFRSQFGLPMLVAVLGGWTWYLTDSWRSRAEDRHNRLALAGAIGLGLLYLALSGSQAMFRQTSVL